MTIDELKVAFHEKANPDQAIPMAAYMKGRFQFLGIKTPERRALTKEFIAQHDQDRLKIRATVDELWQETYREYHYVACDLLKRWKKELTREELPWLKTRIQSNSWWDTVDLIASHPLGTILGADAELRRSTVRSWLEDEDMWVRRSCIIFQLLYKEHTDIELLREVIEHELGDNEFFIQKAIGWALRQYSKVNPESVQTVIDELGISGLAKREASKYL